MMGYTKILLFILLCFFSVLSLSAQFTNERIESGISPKNDIVSVCFDMQGDLWIGTSFGVFRKIDAHWVLEGNSDRYTQAIYADASGCKLIGQWGGGACFRAKADSFELVTDAQMGMSATTFTSDLNHHIWVGTWDKGIFVFNGSSWTNHTSSNALLGDNSILSLACDKAGRIWVGTYHGLSVYENGAWRLFNKSNSLIPDQDIYALSCSTEDNIWIGTCRGLARFSHEKWMVYTREDSPMPSDIILSLAEDAEGRVWIGTPKGLTVYDGRKWKVYTTATSNLPDNRIQTLAVYRSKLYIGTSLGLSILELTDLNL